MKILFLKCRYIRYTIVMLLFAPIAVSAAQGTIAVKGQSITMKQAIKIIENTSDYTFFFKASDIDDTSRKDIDCKGTIDEVLSVIFKGSDVNYVVKEHEIIIKVNKPAVSQQKKTRIISGVVTDSSDGTPIIGANIKVKGSNTGVISDIDGNYSTLNPQSYYFQRIQTLEDE
ncbi:carboxypeptidase-like regulatory domain-containing protein [Bacteroides neonati]|uniref:carboxypeptidase-like regulatory domain-containing protein n=1 Tax=Bacteroides neonati TaxID=1347393 RepID=UPI0004B586AC|nr:carboxypeptidase-like regulatory domain-containing protein [Bacteroides neonati]